LNSGEEIVVGLISDTHGMLRPDVFDVFERVDLILHAGDVGGDDILDELEAIAPVHAVRGNTDWTSPRLADFVEISIGELRMHLSHGHEMPGGSPNAAKLLDAYDHDILVYGHTHKPAIVEANGRWVINPGAAGQRRFNLKPTVALLRVRDRDVKVEVVQLAD
jgi:putative phosphoesterase